MTTELKPRTETEKLFADLDKPSLHALSYALRHPDTWPSHFNWDFRQCRSCAMGLAHALWHQMPRPLSNGKDYNAGSSQMAKAFGMPFNAARDIFYGFGNWAPKRSEQKTTGMWWWKKTTTKIDNDLEAITPEMVADQIDAYLAKAE